MLIWISFRIGFREIREGKSNGREWTIGVEFDESSLLDRGADAPAGKKNDRTKGEILPYRRNSSVNPYLFLLWSLHPRGLGHRGNRGTGRGSTTPSWRSRGTGNEGVRGVELKKEHEERWHDILDADWHLEDRRMYREIVCTNEILAQVVPFQ